MCIPSVTKETCPEALGGTDYFTDAKEKIQKQPSGCSDNNTNIILTDNNVIRKVRTKGKKERHVSVQGLDFIHLHIMISMTSCAIHMYNNLNMINMF